VHDDLDRNAPLATLLTILALPVAYLVVRRRRDEARRSAHQALSLSARSTA
jgi:hypothetical protein